jgi:hypothetical protein
VKLYVNAVNSTERTVQKKAIFATGALVDGHPFNQSAAGAAGVMFLMLQTFKWRVRRYCRAASSAVTSSSSS